LPAQGNQFRILPDSDAKEKMKVRVPLRWYRNIHAVLQLPFSWAFYGPLAAPCATTANLITSGSGGRDDEALSPMQREIRARSLDALSHRADHPILLKEM
jgi:hypothetical protein